MLSLHFFSLLFCQIFIIFKHFNVDCFNCDVLVVGIKLSLRIKLGLKCFGIDLVGMRSLF